jgi:hypothetical protein
VAANLGGTLKSAYKKTSAKLELMEIIKPKA